jgi:hypothetical protein
MIFRYDFSQKIDLSRFRKQIIHYSGKIVPLEFVVFTKNYQFNIKISDKIANDIDGYCRYRASILVYSVSRYADGTILELNPFIILNDQKLSLVPKIIDICGKVATQNPYEIVIIDSKEVIADDICTLILMLYKINDLKVFI